MKRGTFKYVCDDCKEEMFLSRRDRQSRFRPRCQFCGSTWITEKTKYAKDEKVIALDGNRVTKDMIAEKQGF